MVSINKVFLAGNLTRDPEFKKTNNGKSMATFSIAVNKIYKDQNGKQQKNTGFYRIIVWNSKADICSKYLTKGSPVLVEGRLEKHTYKDQNGDNKNFLQIVGDQVSFLGKPKKADQLQEEEPAIF